MSPDAGDNEVRIEEIVDGLLMQFDVELRGGDLPDWSRYLHRCPNAGARADLLALMIRTEQGYVGWDPERAKGRLKLYPDSNLTAGWMLSLVRRLYVDQVESGRRLSLDDFVPFGLSIEELQLRAEDGEPFLGQFIGSRYRLEQRVGEGRFGIVYRATDIREMRPVAVKASRGTSSTAKAQSKDFLDQEAEALRNLSHARIPRLIDLVTEPADVLCMVREFVSGRTLQETIKSGPMVAERAALIAAGIADALDFAHRRGYMHRDLSPGNVIIDEWDGPHLTDFGLALAEKTRFDTMPQAGGTPFFMSTESQSGQVDSLDWRSDIWSLGMVLHSMLIGRSNPFKLDPRQALQSAVLLSTGRPVFSASVPTELAHICEKCMRGDPNARFNTAGEAAFALRRFLRLDTEKVEATPEVLSGRNRRLAAWRMGVKFGACDHEKSVARGWLKHATSANSTSAGSADVSLRTAIRHEIEAIEAYHSAALLAEEIDLKLESLEWAYYQCFEALSKGGPGIAAANVWLSGLMDEVDSSVKQAFELSRTHLRAKGNQIAALFEFAVVAAERLADDDVASMMRNLGRESGLQSEFWTSFVDAIDANAEQEILGREFYRLNTMVERELSYGSENEIAAM